jgi:acyl-CoA reductase-like NAD-dependent aldehyde dehydrogenase
MFQLPFHLTLAFTPSSAPTVKVYSPNDFQPIAQVQYADASDLERLLAVLRPAQARMNALSAHQRAKILRRAAELIGERSERLAKIIGLEGGKPIRDARIEVARARGTLELCAEECLRLDGESIPMDRSAAGEGHLAWTSREPIGPVLAISAFNHPLNLLAHQAGCALASGCVTVIKPAPATPISAHELQQIFLEAGLDASFLYVVHAEIPLIEEMLKSEAFAYVSFVGSARIGWNIRKLIAPGTRLALEHGGHAPAVIRADARLSDAVPQLLKGAFYHSGQVCISTQRIFVHQSIFETFLQQFADNARQLKVGSALHEDTDLGPLIRPAEVVRIRSWIDEAVSAGAKLICGNEVSGEKQQYLSATILTHVPRECKLMQEEVFGPVVCVNSYEDETELFAYLNSSKYLFEASIYTQDLQKGLSLARQQAAMTVVLNNHTAFRVDWMPFGGHGLSGLGMGGVKYAMEEMTRLKQVIVKL